MFRPRRRVMRAAAVGGAAYAVGKRAERRSQHEDEQEARMEALETQQYQAPPVATPPGAISDAAIAELQKLATLKDQGILTQEEFDLQKRRLLGG